MGSTYVFISIKNKITFVVVSSNENTIISLPLLLSPTNNVDILVFNGNHEPGSAKRVDAVNVEQGWTPERRFGQIDLSKLKFSDRFGRTDLII